MPGRAVDSRATTSNPLPGPRRPCSRIGRNGRNLFGCSTPCCNDLDVLREQTTVDNLSPVLAPSYYRVALATMLLTLVGLLGNGAAASSSTPALFPCDRGAYTLTGGLWQAQGGILAAVAVVPQRESPCALNATVTVMVRSRSGAILRVRGNPARRRLSAVLEPWTQLVHSWMLRNECQSTRSFVVTASVNERQETLAYRRLPTARCRDSRATSRVVYLGPGTKFLPAAGDGTPARMLGPGTPVPFSPGVIRMPNGTNGLLVSDGRTFVAVYAGEDGQDPAVGRFAILRQTPVFGIQTMDFVDVRGTGTLRITKAPLGAAVRTSAQRGDIEFSSATGVHGVLHLARDTVELSP